MKTFLPETTRFAQSPISQSRISLSPQTLRLFLAICGLLLAGSSAFGQSNIFTGVFWSGNSFPGYVNVGAKCNPAFEPTVFAVPSSSCTPSVPWTITVADGASAPHTDSETGLHVDVTTKTLRTSGGALPTLNLTGLDIGMGTLTLTDPCGNSEVFAFKIVDCAGGVALVTDIGFMDVIGPNRAVTYYVQAANAGINPSVPTMMEVTGIPVPADCELTSSEMTLGTVVSGEQKVSVLVGALNPGEQKGFTFEMKAKPSAIIGDKFTLLAEFTAPHINKDSQLITIVASVDPNAKYGPPGYGPLHTIQKNTLLPYSITFENDSAALAPAQIVTITDYLDTTKVEPVTLAFGPVHFGSKVVVPPASMNPFSVTVPYDVDGNPLTTADNIFVRVSGSIDQNQFSGTYGKVEWTFESLDAPGGNPPPINIGFLPPNNTQPEGDGGVTFTISQKANLAPGTLITNLASIVFDVNAPILTPVWTNRIVIPSTLGINRTQAGMVRISWSGGVLEQASTVTANDWTNSPVQISPWTFDPAEPMKFFRVRND